ncbi:serine/threonine-protein kinase [Frateuria hangzhouensis]|uniref:serine/threonine-protein kinase n=1 Tax=Frateuria hangzhouensis TaxID=2995589 RepID=UPI002260DF68|nr:serine/threonine-protein kinase [Frateuria sp. STR12]MCX7514496.1 serine/threonine-protein kinase [Frateuria sp. STR12]
MASLPSLRELFEAALPLPADARANLLAERCPDPRLRAQLERMLVADATEGELLSTGDAARAAHAIGDASVAEALPAGSCIGPFELIEVLGEGGSSTVFRACRENDGVRQEVAIKLLARGLYTAEAQRQFRREREALARLRHPGIARLIEGGIADGGLAYIALELVDGQPITDYARERALGLRQRLVLFLMVCRAVETAHRALIVHRDLKPSNVLVTAEGDVKLLDFGIAKLLDEDMTGAPRTQHRALTPAYAAPEQFAQQPVTTATDVYALGILLDELISGRRRAIGATATTTTLPSRTDARSIANAYGLAPSPAAVMPIRRKLRGDLDNIVRKAACAEPDRRYASAGALAEDLERHLDNEPVQAHPPSRWYRAGKFVARHRGGVAITVVFLLAILVSLSVALWQASVARHEAQRAEAIRDFVVNLLGNTAPDVPASQRPDVPTLVYTAAESLPQELRDQPELHAELLYTLGNVLRDMGDYERSEKLLRAADANAADLPASSSVRVQSRMGLVRTLIRRSRYDEAAQRLGPLLAIPARRLPADAPHAELLKIAMVVEDGRGHMDRAVAYGRQMIAAYRADCAAGQRCAALAFATHDLASVLLDADRIAEAGVLANEALARKRRGATPMSLANTIELQSKIALYRGELDAAEAYARKAQALVDSLGNSLHRKPLEPRVQRIDVLLAREDAGAALAQSLAVIDTQRARNASRCSIAWSELQQARARLLLQHPQAAAAHAARALADGASCHRGRDVSLALAELAHGRALAATGDTRGAEAAYARAAASNARVHADDPLSWPLYLIESTRLARALGHGGAAARDARQLVAALDRAQAPSSHPWRLESQLTLAAVAVDDPAFETALGRIRHWPVGTRLARWHAGMKPRR